MASKHQDAPPAQQEPEMNSDYWYEQQRKWIEYLKQRRGLSSDPSGKGE